VSSTHLVPQIPDPSSPRTTCVQPTQLRSMSVRCGANSHLLLWSWISLLILGGFFGISPVLSKLWVIWTVDPLRSIGVVIFAAGIVLVFHVWRQNGWELKGTWWGLLPVAAAFSPVVLSERFVFSWAAGNVKVSVLPYAFPVYLYASGIVLLIAGVGIWRRAWFPLMLLLFVQPVPQVLVQFLDVPLQGLSAHIARSFAALLGLSPANGDLLQLMFTPSFGMFIAPGCDGMRGAITMAYCAMIAGYLKRVPISRWFMYVASAFLLGHIFNLLRLCALVAYYKVALGHSALEHFAKQADYMIGGMLFFVATFLFLWIVFKKANVASAAGELSPNEATGNNWKATSWRTAALAVLVLAAIASALRAKEASPASLVLALKRGEVTAQDLNDRIPPQLGGYRLARAWQEWTDGVPALEAAAYTLASGDEVEIGLWLPPSDHSIETSLLIHGESPKIREVKEITTAAGQLVPFSTAFYDDGVTDTFIGDTYCSPSSCQASDEYKDGIHFAIAGAKDYATRGKRLVPIFFKIQVPHSGLSDQAAYSQLSSACQDFLSHVSFPQLSQRFQ